MRTPKIVIDTNVLVAALRSRQGQSFALLASAGGGLFDHVVSVPLVMEYESVLLREGMVPLQPPAIRNVIDYLCATGIHQNIHYLWRPKLRDAKDDMVLETAINGSCNMIVTHNSRDFAAASSLGVLAMTPNEFLQSHTLKVARP
jgi:putative PIN family toxin of toxin-antitoxin system